MNLLQGRPVDRNTRTGETISYNAFRKLATSASTTYGGKVKRFEAALATSPLNLDQAKRQSGLSNRQLAAYRHQFEAEGRGSASPFERVGNRWQFRGVQGFTHTFIDLHGQTVSATFSGNNLIAAQDYRAAYTDRSQVDLDRWEKAHLSGVTDDNGNVYYPETRLSTIDTVMRQMNKKTRLNFHKQQFYAKAA
jgi:hypothetical protein